MHFGRSRILSVGNDSAAGLWIKDKFRNETLNTQLTSADGGRAALKLLYREDFDLCILDYDLPDMKGVQLCSLMRLIGYSVPIMFFAAINHTSDRERAIAAGANEFLSRPGDNDIFMDSATRLLHLRPGTQADGSMPSTSPKTGQAYPNALETYSWPLSTP